VCFIGICCVEMPHSFTERILVVQYSVKLMEHSCKIGACLMENSCEIGAFWMRGKWENDML
jgi:hypothetical protein